MATAPAAVVRLASHVRGERVIHAKGRTFDGTLRVHGGAGTGVPLLDEPAEHRVLLRLSRSVGLPDLVPEPLGLAIRVLDVHGDGRHQDLLLATGTRQAVVRHLLVPRRGLLRSTYTSLAPYRLAGRSLLFAALPVEPAPAASALDALAPDDVRFALAVGHSSGAWVRWGSVAATAVAEAGRQVRFSPAMTGGGISAPWSGLRGDAYPASHVGPDA